MAVYLVTWDLNKEKPNYSQARQTLISHLERYQHIKDPGLDSVWFVSTDLSVGEIDSDVRQKMDENDRLFVTKIIFGQHQGWLGQDIWGWINARL